MAREGGERGCDGGVGEILWLVAPPDGSGEEPGPAVRITGGWPFGLRGDVGTGSRTGERERGRLGTRGGECGRPDPLLGGEPSLPLFLGGDPGLLDGLIRGDLESRRLGGDANLGGVDERRLLIGDLKGERDPRLGSGDRGLTWDLSLSLRSPLRKLSARSRRGEDLDLGNLLGERDRSRRRAGDLGVGERLLEAGRIGERDLARTTRSV